MVFCNISVFEVKSPFGNDHSLTMRDLSLWQICPLPKKRKTFFVFCSIFQYFYSVSGKSMTVNPTTNSFRFNQYLCLYWFGGLCICILYFKVWQDTFLHEIQHIFAKDAKSIYVIVFVYLYLRKCICALASSVQTCVDKGQRPIDGKKREKKLLSRPRTNRRRNAP